MSSTYPIPGGTATFRDTLKTERQKRAIKSAALAAKSGLDKLPTERPDDQSVQEAIAAAPLTREEAEAVLTVYDATIISFLESWTLPDPLPDEDGLLDLDGDVYDALLEAAAKLQGTVQEQTDFSSDGKPFQPDRPVDEQRPTGESSSFARPSTEIQQSSQTSEQVTPTAPTSGVASST